MMDHISESARTRPTTAAMDAAPFLIASVVAVTALATYLARPARRSSAADEKHPQIKALELESKALRQWEVVEERRRVLAAMTFPVFVPNTDPRAV
jgi:hypothetical protein